MNPDLTAPGALDGFRARFEDAERRVAAFVEEAGRWQRVEREVAALGAAAERGVLHGVPLGVKDIFHVDGLPTRAGSLLPPQALAGAEASSVTRLRRAGAVVVGKTATTEFAYFQPAATRNPHDPERTPGGSSSGSAVAVASGQATLALGTQTIGSVGRPAAFCGVVGFKPSYDRVAKDGVVPLSPSLDHVGLFAPDVAWARRAAAILCGGWRQPPEPPEEAVWPVLAVPDGPYLDSCQPAGRAHFEASCRRLAAAGVSIVRQPVMADFADICARHRRIVAAEAAAVHADWFGRFGDRYRPKTAELIDTGRGIDAAVLAADLAGRAALREELEAGRRAAGADLWLSPPAVGPAPRGLGSTGDPVMNLPWTHAGLPAVVLPAGRPDGLPMGLQLAGGRWGDEALLAAAAAVERALAANGVDAVEAAS